MENRGKLHDNPQFHGLNENSYCMYTYSEVSDTKVILKISANKIVAMSMLNIINLRLVVCIDKAIWFAKKPMWHSTEALGRKQKIAHFNATKDELILKSHETVQKIAREALWRFKTAWFL